MVQADKDLINTTVDGASTLASIGPASQANIDFEQQPIRGTESRHLLSQGASAAASNYGAMADGHEKTESDAESSILDTTS